MLSPEMIYLVNREQHKEKLRDLEKQQLLQAIASLQTTGSPQHRKLVSWLGKQMIKWGSKLEDFDTRPAPDAV